jgi:hypothetical protein
MDLTAIRRRYESILEIAFGFGDGFGCRQRDRDWEFRDGRRRSGYGQPDGHYVHPRHGQHFRIQSVIDNFMTYNGTPLDFKLEAVGPGDLTDPHDCSAATSNGKSCSPMLPGGIISPIILTYNNGGTVVQMFMSGEVSDNGGQTWSTWSGQLSATLTATLDQITTPAGSHVNPTPQNIIAYFLANPAGSITSSHSGTFTAQVVPEPATLVFVGSGMVLVGLLRRRRS